MHMHTAPVVIHTHDKMPYRAGGEMADAPGLGPGLARGGGSSPLLPTKQGGGREAFGDYVLCGKGENSNGERGVPVQQNGSRERGQAEENCDGNFPSA